MASSPMTTKEIAGETFACYIPGPEIIGRADAIGQQVAEDYTGLSPHVIKIALGALPFAHELTFAMQRHNPDIDMTEDVINLSSYGNQRTSSGIVREHSRLSLPFGGRHIIVVEDIVDTGNTLDYFLKRLLYGEPSDNGPIPPASIAVASLLDKPAKHNGRVHVRYAGFDIPPDVWVVGFGLDHRQKGRALPNIYRSLESGDTSADTYSVPEILSTSETES